MKIHKFVSLVTSLFFFLYVFPCSAQLTIILDQIPQNTPDNSEIFVAGNFQEWNPGSTDYQFEMNAGGLYEISINTSAALLEFKFTRGSWETVEGNESGGFLPDRTFQYNGEAQTIHLEILSWEDLGGTNPGMGTAAPNVSILNEAFYIPQLNRDRRIWLYLPPNYETSNKEYPVLYMHDGQNLFDANTSFAGEWEIDETLNQLFEEGDYGCIVVGIDNGGANRLDEYSPWLNPDYGGGQGDEYINFIINNLKPYIDQNYRSKTEPEFTGIMGSSMGGLISLYAGTAYPEVFGRIGSFSPAYWFADEIYDHASDSNHPDPIKIYSIAGEQEGAGVVEDVMDMDDALIGSGLKTEELKTLFHADGQHSEWYWRREFAEAYKWLFEEVEEEINMHFDEIEDSKPKVSYNSINRFIEIRKAGLKLNGNEILHIFDYNGRLLYSSKLISSEFMVKMKFPQLAVFALLTENGLYKGKIVQN